MGDEAAIEAEINEKGLTAPRITPDMLDDEIKTRQFHVFEGSCLTVCALTLRNGFVVTGESAAAGFPSPRPARGLTEKAGRNSRGGARPPHSRGHRQGPGSSRARWYLTDHPVRMADATWKDALLRARPFLREATAAETASQVWRSRGAGRWGIRPAP